MIYVNATAQYNILWETQEYKTKVIDSVQLGSYFVWL